MSEPSQLPTPPPSRQPALGGGSSGSPSALPRVRPHIPRLASARPHGGGELPSPGLAAAGPKNSPKSPSESLSEGSKQGPSFSRRMRLSPGLSPLNRFVSGNPLRMIPSIHLPVSLRSSGTRPADGAREQPYESASEEAAHAGVATTADQGAGVGLAQPPSWRATTMVLASEFDLQPGAQRIRDESEARWKARRAQQWLLSRVQIRRRLPPVSDDRFEPIVPEANITLRRQQQAQSAGLRPLNSFVVMTAPSAPLTSNAPSGALRRINVVGAGRRSRERLHGSATAAEVREMASERCRIIERSLAQEQRLSDWWYRRYGAEAIGLEAETAKLRATQAAALAMLNYEQVCRARVSDHKVQPKPSIQTEPAPSSLASLSCLPCAEHGPVVLRRTYASGPAWRPSRRPRQRPGAWPSPANRPADRRRGLFRGHRSLRRCWPGMSRTRLADSERRPFRLRLRRQPRQQPRQ